MARAVIDFVRLFQPGEIPVLSWGTGGEIDEKSAKRSDQSERLSEVVSVAYSLIRR
jgi:hypothetical protein